MHCTICQGDLALIGTLGRNTWYRCRDCGTEQAKDRDVARRATRAM